MRKKRSVEDSFLYILPIIIIVGAVLLIAAFTYDEFVTKPKKEQACIDQGYHGFTTGNAFTEAHCYTCEEEPFRCIK